MLVMMVRGGAAGAEEEGEEGEDGCGCGREEWGD